MLAFFLSIAIGSPQISPLELSVAAPKRPWHREITFKFGDQSDTPEFAPFDTGLLITQDSRFVMLAASDGHIAWDVTHAAQDPPASLGTPQALRFGKTLIFSQQRQGKDYVTALTSLDLGTGKLKWHRSYPTTVFNSKKVGDHLMTEIGAHTREVSLADGSLYPYITN